eukprot:jgi/Botrbrau1/12309/Bobra.0205s0008.1
MFWRYDSNHISEDTTGFANRPFLWDRYACKGRQLPRCIEVLPVDFERSQHIGVEGGCALNPNIPWDLQRLHAFEARVSRTTSRKSGDSVQNKNDNINKLADTVAKAVVDAAALSLLMVEVARSKDGSSKPKSASINTERLEQHLDVLQRELEEVKQLLEANEQMQRQGQRPD